MYYPYFIAYITIGLTISLVVFYWAFKTGQFTDQQRARFLPLRGDTDQPRSQQSTSGPHGDSRLRRRDC